MYSDQEPNQCSPSDCNTLNFKACVKQQSGYANKSARRVLLSKECPINVVECLIKIQVSSVNLDGYDIVHRHAGRFDIVLYRIHNVARLIGRIIRNFKILISTERSCQI
jgi:hypothetical protein